MMPQKSDCLKFQDTNNDLDDNSIAYLRKLFLLAEERKAPQKLLKMREHKSSHNSQKGKFNNIFTKRFQVRPPKFSLGIAIYRSGLTKDFRPGAARFG
jgi:hypothetical protein